MKNLFVCLALAGIAPAATAAMSRVIAVKDSRTLIVAGSDGVQRAIVLRGVDIPPDSEAVAVAHLRRIVERSWVYIENGGDVYRSPDVLFVNGEMIRRAWRASGDIKYLGELDLGPRSKGEAAGRKLPADPKLAAPPKRSTPASRGTTGSPSKSPRSGRAQPARAPSRR